MSFYGNKTNAAELAGVEESEITDAKIDVINSHIDVLIRPEGFSSKSADEYYDFYKDTQNELVLKNFPIISISSIFDKASSDAPVVIDPDSYVIDTESGILQLIGTKRVSGNGITVFTKGKNTLRVQYTYGYANVPTDIEQFATILMARYLRMESLMADTGILKSIKIGNYTESYGTNEQTPWDAQLLKMENRLQMIYCEGV